MARTWRRACCAYARIELDPRSGHCTATAAPRSLRLGLCGAWPRDRGDFVGERVRASALADSRTLHQKGGRGAAVRQPPARGPTEGVRKVWDFPLPPCGCLGARSTGAEAVPKRVRTLPPPARLIRRRGRTGSSSLQPNIRVGDSHRQLTGFPCLVPFQTGERCAFPDVHSGPVQRHTLLDSSHIPTCPAGRRASWVTLHTRDSRHSIASSAEAANAPRLPCGGKPPLALWSAGWTSACVPRAPDHPGTSTCVPLSRPLSTTPLMP